MKKYLFIIFCVVLFFPILGANVSYASNKKEEKKTTASKEKGYGAQLGDCERAASGKEEQAEHYFFSLDGAKKLLKDAKIGASCLKKVTLLESKIALFDQQVTFYKLQLERADVAVSKNEQARKELGKRVLGLEDSNKKLVLENAKLRGDSWKMLVIGLAVGVGVAALTATGIALAVSLK